MIGTPGKPTPVCPSLLLLCQDDRFSSESLPQAAPPSYAKIIGPPGNITPVCPSYCYAKMIRTPGKPTPVCPSLLCQDDKSSRESYPSLPLPTMPRWLLLQGILPQSAPPCYTSMIGPFINISLAITNMATVHGWQLCNHCSDDSLQLRMIGICIHASGIDPATLHT